MTKNLSWSEEFDRRLRRVAGVTDDSLSVRVVGGQKGFCSTCADYAAWVEVENAEARLVGESDVFESSVELLHAVLAVTYEQVHLS